MKYHSYIDLPGWQVVAEKIKNWLMDRPNLWNEQHGAWSDANMQDFNTNVPELAELFKPLNLTIRFVAFFTMSAKQSGIHRDAGTETIRINIPIQNCEGSVTRFFKATKPPIKYTQPDGIPYFLEDQESCILESSVEIIKPTILRVHEPHQVVIFHTNYPRITCTISFNEDLEHLLA